jgi:hypothetical protein
MRSQTQRAVRRNAQSDQCAAGQQPSQVNSQLVDCTAYKQPSSHFYSKTHSQLIQGCQLNDKFLQPAENTVLMFHAGMGLLAL